MEKGLRMFSLPAYFQFCTESTWQGEEKIFKLINIRERDKIIFSQMAEVCLENSKNLYNININM